MALTPWNRQEEWYQAMIDAAGSGGLPPVTSADDGKVLTANSGVWVAASPSGGGVLVVTDTAGTLDKTWQEIHDAEAAIISLSNNAGSKSWYIVTGVKIVNDFIVSACRPGVNGKTGEPENDFRRYFTGSADGYPIIG